MFGLPVPPLDIVEIGPSADARGPEPSEVDFLGPEAKVVWARLRGGATIEVALPEAGVDDFVRVIAGAT
jgi:hypothetical protein